MNRTTIILAYPKIDHEKDYVYFWMPFSLLVIAGALRDAGTESIKIFDANLETSDAWVENLVAAPPGPLMIGFSIMTGGGQIGHALEMAEVARRVRPDALLVYGGPHVNVMPEETLMHSLVDAVVPGPGQNSMPMLMNAMAGKTPFITVPGLMLKTQNGITKGPLNPPRTQVIGRYPWDMVPVRKYIRNDPTVATRTLNYVSSQGCVYKCRFCYELTYQRKYSAIQGDALLDDLTELKARFAINGVKFYDADFFVDRKRAAGFCSGLKERGLQLAWAASINPNDILKGDRDDGSFLEKIASSGCTRLLMGMESGSDRVLKEIVRKEVTRRQLFEVAEMVARHGILGSYTFIVGFPGESDDEIEDGVLPKCWSRRYESRRCVSAAELSI